MGEEICATIKSKLGLEYSPDEIKEYISNFESNSGFIPDKIKKVGIIMSYDMGWQKRSTGCIYNSLSGYGYLIECVSGKVVSFGVRCKKCVKCTRANNIQTVAGPHLCTVRHDESSGSIETSLALELKT